MVRMRPRTCTLASACFKDCRWAFSAEVCRPVFNFAIVLLSSVAQNFWKWYRIGLTDRLSMDSQHHLARRAGIFTSATMLSRILGYVRDSMVANFFGAGAAADAFYAAFRISNLFRRLLGEGALSASFIPVFS